MRPLALSPTKAPQSFPDRCDRPHCLLVRRPSISQNTITNEQERPGGYSGLLTSSVTTLSTQVNHWVPKESLDVSQFYGLVAHRH